MQRVKLVAFCAALMFAAGCPLWAQTITTVRPGAPAVRVTSIADSAMSYAVYLPSAYTAAHKWPIAFLLDPRGRAEIPLERARAAAEQYGYILISSYNTLSDSATDVNVRAMSAMLEDAQRALNVDRRRFYLVGFSGTARMAWELTANLGGAVAGMFGSGASGSLFAQTTRKSKEQLRDFAYYGAVGETDFNYEEMRGFEEWLLRNEVPHRVRYVPGGHAWPADSVFTDALRWFELRAQTTGLVPFDTVRLHADLAVDTTRAHALEEAGEPADAMARWREIQRDYAAFKVGTYAKRRADQLALTGRARRTLSLRRDLHQRFVDFNDELKEWVRQVTEAKQPPDAKRGAKMLELERRLADAGGSDHEAALAARRELEQAFVMLSFYEPRALLAAREPERALRLLEVAELIRPENGGVALHRAYAWVQLGESDRAIADVKRALAAGMSPARLWNDPSLAALKNDARFQSLVRQENAN